MNPFPWSVSFSSTNEHSPPGRRGWSGCLIGILGMAGLLGGSYWYLENPGAPTISVGPMVQMPAPGKLTIVWEWNAPWGGSFVQWTVGGKTHSAVARKVKGNVADRFEADIEGLAPGASITYNVASASIFGRMFAVGGSHTVQSAPPRGQAFRFIAFGDSGMGGNSQFDLGALMGTHKCDLVIHTGDLIYPAGDPRDYARKFFDPYVSLLPRVPFMASLGNHDCATEKGRPLLNEFVLPENGPTGVEAERNYWFDYGDARFVALDTNRSSELGAISFDDMKSKVAPWLRKVLSETDARWKFVFFHHPPYTGSTHDAAGQAFVKEAYCAIFDETGVDIVFTGHNHLFERTAPIKGDKVVGEGEGPVYITTGAGGASKYPEELPAPEYMRVYKDNVFSFTAVELSPERLSLRQIDENEKVLDEYTIDKPLKASGPSGSTTPPAP